MAELETPAKLAALEVDVTGLKGDLSGLKTDVGALAVETRGGFARIFDRIEGMNSKGTNWNAILGFAAVLFTVVIALATWANTYFGQAIAGANREAIRAIEAHAMLSGQIEAIRRTELEAAIFAARLDERQKFNAAEVDRLRARDNPAPYEAPAARP